MKKHPDSSSLGTWSGIDKSWFYQLIIHALDISLTPIIMQRSRIEGTGVTQQELLQSPGTAV